MGRGYKRKTHKFDQETLRNAVLDVNEGMPLREASRLHDVSRTSLRRQSKFSKAEGQSFATHISSPSEASEPSAHAVPPEVPPEEPSNESPVALALEDFVIRDRGRKKVCLSFSVLICALL